MEPKKPRRVFDPYGETERKLASIEERMQKIEERTKRSFENFQRYLTLVNNITRAALGGSIIASLLMQKDEGTPQDFEVLIISMLREESDRETIKKMGLEPVASNPEATLAIVLGIARKWQLSFERIVYYLIGRLGKQYLRGHLSKEAILSIYGSDALRTWEILLKE